MTVETHRDMQNTQPHTAFSWQRSQHIESLNITVEEYKHHNTGAIHYHIAADNNENVFLVALRTVPMDSTGVAHILEHTALCGSKRYPVRDPFFMMIRRSLNTFMNAFTSSDWTAYPFASQNRKDFNNLLDVYLDAVFFSRLDEMDFLQEGHRVEFAETDNAESDLIYKGVVFNEMKGAMSSVTSTLWQTVCKHLFPTNTYHYNSGGDPEKIPDLSYQQLKEFYKTHYHPSNAIFMTFGDISAAEHQQHFEEKALSQFEKLDTTIEVAKETRYKKPIKVTESYAFDEEGSSDNKTHLVMGWLLGESTNLQDLLQAQLLSSVLLDNSSSPLQKVLETTDLASSPSPLCGLEDSMREIVFVCGVEGTNRANKEAIENLILNTIEDVAYNGVEYEQVAAVLHQLELHQREVGGDGYPYGLQLILSALGNATHRGDPIAALNLDPVLEQLHHDIKDPDFIKGLAKRLLIDNSHRVSLLMVPDTELSTNRDRAESEKLAALKAKMNIEEKQNIITMAKELNQRQQSKDDESILPKVGLADVPADIQEAQGKKHSINNLTTNSYAQGTNGLVYQQILIEIPVLSTELITLLPYYTSSLTELGIGQKDYLETQRWQAEVCGGINAFTTMRGDINDEQTFKAYFVLSSKSLARNQHQQTELMQETLDNVRFDELNRLKELISQLRARREQSVTNNGHSLAMSAASSGMSPTAMLSHKLSGLAGIQAIKSLDKALEDDNELKAYAEKLATIHQHITQAPRQILLVAEQERLVECENSFTTVFKTAQQNPTDPFTLEKIRQPEKQLWIANTQVNFCAKAYPTVTVNHPDAAPLTVLGGFLRNGFLHRAIREQGGAYGGGASQDSNIAAFRFYSYRDPRLIETLNDFDLAINWLLENDHHTEQLEQAILGVIGSLDKPSSPAGEAKQAFHNNLFGRTLEQRRQFRQAILNTTIDDLKRATIHYLKGSDDASIGIVTNQTTFQQVEEFVNQHNIDVFNV